MSSRLLIILSLFISSIAGAQTTTVYFEFNGSRLSNESRRALDEFVSGRNVRSLGIFGHTDQMGSEEYNEWLSVQRAKSVRDYLLSKGVGRNRISLVRGFGATRLITDQTDSASLQLNRRVVITSGYKPSAADSAVAARQANLKFVPKDSLTAKQPVVTNAPAQNTVKAQPPVVKREVPIVKQQKSDNIVEDIKDKNTKAGENIVLKNINFHPGSHFLLESALPAMQSLLAAMQQIPTLEIEIQGHVCCQEGDLDAIDNATGELALSVNRAKAVYDYLVEKGINKNRLSYKGLAHQYPLIQNEVTEEDRIANRRVEIKIIKK